MFPANFEYVRAESVDHALRLLAQHGEDAKLLAGGHSLLPAMKLRLARPKLLVDIGRLRELQYIREESGQIAIGALTTHYQIETSPLIASGASALSDAARVVADAQIRNKGTIGGVLAHADPAADYPAVLLALGAELVVAGSQGSRTVSIDDFFSGPFTSVVAPGEILTEIRIPAARIGMGSVYRKLTRRANDYGMVGVAVNLTVESDRVCRDARIGITCVALTPYRAQKAEAGLHHRQLTPATIAAAAELADDSQIVLEDAYISSEYRSHVTRVETRRAIEDALARTGM